MTIGQLKQILEDLPDDAEVRIAHQPNYPFELSVGNCVYVEKEEPEEVSDDEDEEDCDLVEIDEDCPGVLYIAEGHQLGYLSKQAENEIGW